MTKKNTAWSLHKNTAVYLTAALLLVLCAVLTAPVHATGVGPVLDVKGGAVIGDDTNVAADVSLGCSLKLDRIPIYWSLTTGALFFDWSPSDDSFFDVTLTGDYWILNPAISATWKWYFGAGGAISGGVGTNGYIAAGPRIVAGLNTFTFDGAIEVFMQCAAQAQAMLLNWDAALLVTIPLSAGMRLWY